MAVDQSRVKVRNTTLKALVLIADGPEKKYPVYQFSNRRDFVEKPGRSYPA